ncbi:MAG: energy transducer TonB [Burkholderiales bacterium]|nr:energy transducer TonB [Burkholderiales bacterium]
MSIKKYSFIATLLLASVTAYADEPTKTEKYVVKEDTNRTGSMLKSDAISSTIPLDKSYEDLTAAQKDYVKSKYEKMGPNDEPPYPVGGPAQIYREISKGRNKIGMSSGTLFLAVEIDDKGEPGKVEVYESPDIDLSKFAAKIVARHKYKPAICNGVPCKMQYPIEIRFSALPT